MVVEGEAGEDSATFLEHQIASFGFVNAIVNIPNELDFR
jgi:hypothetical protein